MKTDHIHLIGIGGSGLSAIARILLEQGYQVSGSDQSASEQSNGLVQLGARISIGHDPRNITGADLVIRSSAIPDSNPEVKAAKSLNIPVLKRNEFLNQLLASKETVAIGGTHGKTTTTAMAAWVLTQIGLDPSYIIGGLSKDLGNNAHDGSGKYFVIEADEYDYMFFGLEPAYLIITNIDYDHPDCYPTRQDYQEAFSKFIQRMRPGGTLIMCIDDQVPLQVQESLPGKISLCTYGFHENADYRIENAHLSPIGGYHFDLMTIDNQGNRQLLSMVDLKIPGKHNMSNAAGVLALIDRLGLSISSARDAISLFTGTARRYDVQGTVNGITIISDYAHHPNEIRSTLEAAKTHFQHGSLWAIWQPHTYSRLNTFYQDFLNAFTQADRVVVTDIYTAREDTGDFSYTNFIQDMHHPNAIHRSKTGEIVELVTKELKPGDAVIILSAGDANDLCNLLLDKLSSMAGGSAL